MPIEYAENESWWDRTQAKAKEMSTEALYGAIADIQKTLACADTMDRVNGTDLGGVYRDEISVYRTELGTKLRKMRETCNHCGK